MENLLPYKNNDNKWDAYIMIRKTIIVLTCLGALFPLSAFAGWQMVTSQQVGNNQPFFQAGQQSEAPLNANINFPKSYTHLGKPAFTYSLTLLPGTIKENIERIMANKAWKVIWVSEYDYPVIGSATFTGTNLEDVLSKILINYPLQATFYEKNHVMTIQSRKF